MLAQCGLQASAHVLAEATQFGTMIVSALPAAALGELIAYLAPHLNGKILIDTTNNVRAPLSGGGIATGGAQAAIYRVFNSIGWENIEQPLQGAMRGDLIFCGTPAQRTVAEELIIETGLTPVYIGDLDQVPVLDMLTGLWFALAFGQGPGWRIGFRVLRD